MHRGNKASCKPMGKNHSVVRRPTRNNSVLISRVHSLNRWTCRDIWCFCLTIPIVSICSSTWTARGWHQTLIICGHKESLKFSSFFWSSPGWHLMSTVSYTATRHTSSFATGHPVRTAVIASFPTFVSFRRFLAESAISGYGLRVGWGWGWGLKSDTEKQDTQRMSRVLFHLVMSRPA